MGRERPPLRTPDERPEIPHGALVTGGTPRPRDEHDGLWLVAAAIAAALVLVLTGVVRPG